MIDAYAAMSDYEFMRVYRSRYWHEPRLKARLDQASLGTDRWPLNYKPQGLAPGSTSEKIAAERVRRGLTFPQSWIDAGLRAADEDF